MFRKLIAGIARYLDELDEVTRNGIPPPVQFTVRPHEKTEWGMMFAIVDPRGEIVGYDRKVPAEQRCAALNSGHKG